MAPGSTAEEVASLRAEDLLAPLLSIARVGRVPAKPLSDPFTANAARVSELPPDRLYALMTPALCSRHPHVMLQWLRDTGMLVRLLPEVDATVAFSQEGGRRHKDVWEHTKAVVWQSVPRPAVRWAALLHDIGKVRTRRYVGAKVTFHGHAEEGARMFLRGAARRIGFPSEMVERIELLIRHHLRGGQYDGSWTDSAVRRFALDMDPILVDLLDLSRADVTSKRPGKRKRCLSLISELSRRIRELREVDGRPKPLPAGLGNHLMQALGLPPGRHIGQLRERLQALYDAGTVEGGREPEYYVEVVRAHDLLGGIAVAPPRGF